MNALFVLRPAKLWAFNFGHPCPPSKKGEVLLLGQAEQLWWGLLPICTINEIFRTIPLAFRRLSVCVCLVGFASIAIVVVCGRCVLHRLFATTCKHPCLKPLGTHAKASLPLYERSVGFASLQSLWAFISGILALLAPPEIL